MALWSLSLFLEMRCPVHFQDRLGQRLEFLPMSLCRTTFSALAAVALASGCASTHNMATDGTNLLGGGYWESKIADGVYQVSVKTNFAPWVNTSGARSAWRSRAQALCGTDAFREFKIVESSFDQMPGVLGALRYIITTRDGVAVCPGANLSDPAVASLLDAPR